MNNNTLTIENRETLYLNNVVSVETLSDEKVVVFTENGDLVVRGKSLVTSDFNVSDGYLSLSGKIDAVEFTSDGKHYPDNFVSKLFK